MKTRKLAKRRRQNYFMVESKLAGIYLPKKHTKESAIRMLLNGLDNSGWSASAASRLKKCIAGYIPRIRTLSWLLAKDVDHRYCEVCERDDIKPSEHKHGLCSECSTLKIAEYSKARWLRGICRR